MGIWTREQQSASIPREMHVVRMCVHGRKGRMLREDTDEETGAPHGASTRQMVVWSNRGGRREGILQAIPAKLRELGSHVIWGRHVGSFGKRLMPQYRAAVSTLSLLTISACYLTQWNEWDLLWGKIHLLACCRRRAGSPTRHHHFKNFPAGS